MSDNDLPRPGIDFVAFPKISRFNRGVVVTEKIDGTNAQVYVNAAGDRAWAGSRTRWITPQEDNHGFARWVAEHHDELLKLGPGSHFGEWWGRGIQRNYGLAEKRFSLFNTSRWGRDEARPACCHVVPVLWEGLITELCAAEVLRKLAEGGSRAVPGFKDPEGIVIFHTAGNSLYKMTIDGDQHKGV